MWVLMCMACAFPRPHLYMFVLRDTTRKCVLVCVCVCVHARACIGACLIRSLGLSELLGIKLSLYGIHHYDLSFYVSLYTLVYVCVCVRETETETEMFLPRQFLPRPPLRGPPIALEPRALGQQALRPLLPPLGGLIVPSCVP